jgi:hypothetical protein
MTDTLGFENLLISPDYEAQAARLNENAALDPIDRVKEYVRYCWTTDAGMRNTKFYVIELRTSTADAESQSKTSAPNRAIGRVLQGAGYISMTAANSGTSWIGHSSLDWPSHRLDIMRDLQRIADNAGYKITIIAHFSTMVDMIHIDPPRVAVPPSQQRAAL